MDPLTHGLLGAAVGQATARRSLIKQASWIAALAAMAPDLDIYISSDKNPLLGFIYHRNFTHSLFFAPIGGLLVASLFLLIFKKLRSAWRLVIMAAILGMATHGLLDSATSYGTLWFWPFSYQRISGDLIAIIDPVFTAMLLIGVALGYAYVSRYFAVTALLGCFLYLGFGYFQHDRALRQQQVLVAMRGQSFERSRVMPYFGNLLGFSSIYTYQGHIYIDSIETPLFESAYVKEGSVVPLVTAVDLPEEIRRRPILIKDFLHFYWFSDGFTGLISKHPFTVGDFRYTRGMKSPKPFWGIVFPLDLAREHVYLQRKF